MAVFWHYLPYKPGTDLIVGTYLAAAFVEGTGKRYAVYERRTRVNRIADIAYDVKDAEALTDAEVLAGKLAPTVFSSVDLDAAVGWVEARMKKQ